MTELAGDALKVLAGIALGGLVWLITRGVAATLRLGHAIDADRHPRQKD